MVNKTREGVIVLVYPDWESYRWTYDFAGRRGLERSLPLYSLRSFDEGQTWIDRQKIYDPGADRGQIIQARSGDLVLAMTTTKLDPCRGLSFTLVSADNGRTWTRSNLIDLGGNGDHEGAMEPTIIELKNGRLWMLIRTTWDRFWEAFSEDNGLTWRTIRPTNIDASNAPGHLERLASGRIALVWNRLYPEGLRPEQQKAYPRRAEHFCLYPTSWHRQELSIAFSDDEGKTWTKPVVLAKAKEDKWGLWVSYPYLFEAEPGTLWIFASQGKAQIRASEAALLEAGEKK